MSESRFEALRLDHQVCFPLYACSREVIKRYTPLLEPLDLTYTQYIAMMVLWENHAVTIKEMGEKLFLDSGTLTPLMKKLESKGLLTRARSQKDERNLIVSITEKGKALREKALHVPEAMACCVDLSQQEAAELYRLCYKILGHGQDAEKSEEAGA